MKLFLYKNNVKNICGKKIREERQRQQLSQTELAASLKVYGVSLDQKAMSRIELQIRVVADFELMAFAKVLQVDMMDLLEIETQQRR